MRPAAEHFDALVLWLSPGLNTSAKDPTAAMEAFAKWP